MDIRDEVFDAFQQALLHGDKAYLKKLHKKYAEAIKPPTLEEVGRIVLESPDSATLSAEDIVQRQKDLYEQRMQCYNDQRRLGYITDLETAINLLPDLNIGYRGYTPIKNVQQVLKYAFNWTSIALICAACFDLAADMTLGNYISSAFLGGVMGGLHGSIKNINRFFEHRDDTARFLQAHFRL